MKKHTENIPFICSFSGGKSSALATLIHLHTNLDSYTEIIYCNTGFEHIETLRFVKMFETHYNIPVTWLEYSGSHSLPSIVNFYSCSKKGEPFIKLCNERKMLPNRVSRFCTSELKIKCIKKYLKSKKISHYNAVLGIRYDEQQRWARLINNQDKDVFNYSFPLYELKITKEMVNEFWIKQPITLNLPHYLGNCTLCFNKGKGNLLKALDSNESHFTEFNKLETDFKRTFSNRYSLNNLSQLSLHQTKLFPTDFEDLPCNCSSD